MHEHENTNTNTNTIQTKEIDLRYDMTMQYNIVIRTYEIIILIIDSIAIYKYYFALLFAFYYCFNTNLIPVYCILGRINQEMTEHF